MKDHVSWVIELAVKGGELDTFTALMEEMVEGTSTEPPTLNYEWYISEDDSVVHIFEKYADSEAMSIAGGGAFSRGGLSATGLASAPPSASVSPLDSTLLWKRRQLIGTSAK